MYSFEACSDAGDFVKPFTRDLRADGFLMGRHMKLGEAIKVTEGEFIAVCYQYIGDIHDTVAQTSVATEAAIFTESMGSMLNQLKKLEPWPLQEGVKV